MKATQTSIKRSASDQAERQLERGQELIARARAEQAPGLYAEAESNIKAALHSFEDDELLGRVAIAQDLLATCYWRQGDTGKARKVLRVALAALPVEYIVERLTLTNTLILVENLEKHYDKVIALSPSVISDAELLGAPYYVALAHSNCAHALKYTGVNDPAIFHYTAASIKFEEAGHTPFMAATDNNLAELLVRVGRTEDARLYLDRAQDYYEAIRDRSALAQIYETRSQADEADGNLSDALASIECSISYLEGGDEKGLLEESYKTRDRILEQMGVTNRAAKPPWSPPRQHLRLVKCGDRTPRKRMDAVQLLRMRLGTNDRSLVDLGPGFAPGSELTFMPASSAHDGALTLIKERATGDHYVGYYRRNVDGSVCLTFANSDPDTPYAPLFFPDLPDIEIVGILYPPRQ